MPIRPISDRLPTVPSHIRRGAGMHRSMVTQRSRVTIQKHVFPTKNKNTKPTHEVQNSQYYQIASTSIHHII
jgi:hypothetical protein